jgi:hypothetical protein
MVEAVAPSLKDSGDVTAALRLNALIGILSTARLAMKKGQTVHARRLSETLQVLEVEVRFRVGAGIAPPSGVDPTGRMKVPRRNFRSAIGPSSISICDCSL